LYYLRWLNEDHVLNIKDIMKSTNIKDKMPSKNIIKASVINLLETIVYSVAFLLGNYYD
jgi:hypothetical protein